MNNYRLTFNASSNLMLPTGVYDILFHDAYYFGYIKNDKPNINGFLNHLIPVLSDYRDDLHQKFLKYNNGNEEITRIVEQNIHNVYLAPFNFSDDARVNVPFRINKNQYDDFVKIHDVKLSYYNTDFTNFVRNLLSEYAAKTINQREYLYHFRLMDDLQNAIINNNLCHFHMADTVISFVPVSIDVSPISRKNYIVGISADKMSPLIVSLKKIKSIAIDRNKFSISEEDCTKIVNYFNEFIEKESFECLE